MFEDVLAMLNFKSLKMKNLFVSLLLLVLLVPLAGESYVGELFKKKKKKAETEEVKPPVKKKKDKYEVLMKSSGIVTAKGDFLTIHKVGQKIYLEYPLKYIGRDILVGGTLSATSEPLALNVGYKYKVIIYYFTVCKGNACFHGRTPPSLRATSSINEATEKVPSKGTFFKIFIFFTFPSKINI